MGILHKKPNVARLEAKRKLKALIKALNCKTDCHIRKAAAEALGRIGDPRAIELRGGKAAIADTTKYMGLMGVATFDEVGSVREAATEAIVRIGEPALPVLMDRLQPRHFQEGLIASHEPVAAYILGQIGDPRAVNALLHALFRGVDTAPEALFKIGGAATTSICDAFQLRAGRVWHARDRRHGARLFEILGQVGGQGAVVPLLKYIKTGQRKDDSVVYPFLQEAGMALERIIKGKEIELLSPALNEKYWLVRVAAADELGKISNPEAAAVLRKALADGVSEVRESAKKALRNFQKT